MLQSGDEIQGKEINIDGNTLSQTKLNIVDVDAVASH